MSSARNLQHLQPGESGIVETVEGHALTAQKLMQIGFVPGESVRVVRMAPLGGPMEVEIMGYRLAIRRRDAQNIRLRSSR